LRGYILVRLHAVIKEIHVHMVVGWKEI
jgi:hypothetical protein